MKKVFLDNLPRHLKSKNIDWKASVGLYVKFIYDELEGELYINKYSKDGTISIKYNENDDFYISNYHLKEGKIGRLIGKVSNEYKFDVGDILYDNNRNIIITQRAIKIDKSNRKWKAYKYKCLSCGFDCGEHYKTGSFVKELLIEEHSLVKGTGCSCCSNNVSVIGINDIPTTVPNLVKYFQGGYDEAKRYAKGSRCRILPICPDCKSIKKTGKIISDIINEGSIGCKCGDGVSYPEKLMVSVINNYIENMVPQFIINESTKYRYDFYFEYNNEKYILETHGLQHYKNSSGVFTKTLDEQIEIDNIKKQLALYNGIKEENYIVIDCRWSNLEFIKNNILKSKLSETFDLSIIDWSKCEEFALSNRVKEACELKRLNPNYTTNDIGKIMKLTSATISSYLKKGNKLGWCNYNTRIEMANIGRKNGGSNRRNVSIYKDGELVGMYDSVADLSKASVISFGVELSIGGICKVCRLERKKHKGFEFSYN